MMPVEHNGEGFHYIVSYKRRESNVPSLASKVTSLVTDWRQSQLVVKHVETYAEYVVAVQAANNVGTAPQSTVERRIGHSGEDGECGYSGCCIRAVLEYTSDHRCNKRFEKIFLKR